MSISAASIEHFDQRRLRYLEGYLAALTVFLALWVARFFMRAGGGNEEPIGFAVLAGLVLTLAVQAFFGIRLTILARVIRADSDLCEALNNELVQSCEIRSWRIAFFAAIGTTCFFALVSFVYPVTDLVFVALSSVIVGAGAQRAGFYFLYRIG